MSNTIQNKVATTNNGNEKKTMQMYIKSMEGEIKKALPSVITPERFTRMTLSAISTNPKLAQCTPASFLGAMMSAAQLGLEPNTPLGQAYLIPYKNRGNDEVQFQIGYKGLIDLAYSKTKRKNAVPKKSPKGMLSKTLGKVANIRPGPFPRASSFPPENTNTAGIIINPARIAIPVSKNSMFLTALSILTSFFI